MKAKVVEDADVVTYVVVCDPGDEAGSELARGSRHRDSGGVAQGDAPRYRARAHRPGPVRVVT